uniref:KH type-2 domain-containing protein n=1 Tax=Oncorhynchus tshawytscha TaxID=74940 RepID=A0AAZ3RK25_ONCTS
MAVQISKKRKFVADGIFKAELNEFLTRELAEDGYSGVEVRVTPTRTEIIILATRTQNVLGEKGRRIRELTAVVQKRFGFPEGNVEHCGAQRRDYPLHPCVRAEGGQARSPSSHATDSCTHRIDRCQPFVQMKAGPCIFFLYKNKAWKI